METTATTHNRTTVQNAQDAGDCVVMFVLLAVLAVGFIREGLGRKRARSQSEMWRETDKYAPEKQRKAA